MSTPSGHEAGPKKRSLFHLLTELPHLFAELIRAELEQLRVELLQRLKGTGLGLGYVVIVLNLVVWFVLLLVLAAIFALSLVLPLWASALIAAATVLVAIAVFSLLAVRAFRGTSFPVPERTIESVREDVRRIRGDHPRAPGSR